MAPHGRPKLKRPPRADAPDLSKNTQEDCVPTSEVTSEPLNPSEVKTPTANADLTSAPIPLASPGVKSPVNDERGSPEPNCAICLGNLRNKSFTDSCLHQFCFKCLVQWSKVKPECPLCKQSFKSIIHNVRSNEDYDQYHCRPTQNGRESLINELLTFSPRFSGFRYRTTQVSGQRRLGTFNETTIHELFLQHQNMAYVIPPASRWSSSRTRRQLVTAEFRASIYNRDMWVQDQPDITGRYRECSPEFYRVNQAQIHRLVPWLNREIPSVTQSNSTHAQVILDLILSLIAQHCIRSRIMYSRLRPFFGTRTSHFLHEFHAFARSPYDLIGFDQAATYGPNPNPTVFTPDMDEPIYFSDSDNSDVIILESDGGVEPVAGPSGLGQHPVMVLSVQPESSQATSTNSREDPLVVEDSDDCEIVDYVKPRHERTPEIIVLSDSDVDVTRLDADCNDLWDSMLDLHDSLSLDVNDSGSFTPHVPSSSSSESSRESSSTSEYTPYTSRSTSKRSVPKTSRKKKSKSSHNKKKSSSKATKMRAQATFSDSDEEDTPRKSSRCKRHSKSEKGKSRKTSQRVLPSPTSSCESDLPGTSGLRRRSSSSLDSLSLEEDDNATGVSNREFTPLSIAQRLWPVHSSPEHFSYHSTDIEYKPNISNFASHCSHEASPMRYNHNRSPPLTQVKPDPAQPPHGTWCIKPSCSNREETTEEDASSHCSSGSGYRPKLKSIVIMRTNISNHHTRTRSESPVSNKETFRRHSRSPVASTSRTQLQSCSPPSSRYSLQFSALMSARGKVSKHKYKSKTSKREHKRSRTSSSDSDSNWERSSKKQRTTKWHFNESSEDSPY